MAFMDVFNVPEVIGALRQPSMAPEGNMDERKRMVAHALRLPTGEIWSGR